MTQAVVAAKQAVKRAKAAKRAALKSADQRQALEWRAQHAAGVEDVETMKAGVTLRRVQAPLDWYWSRKLITGREFDAGDRLRQAHEIGVLGVRQPRALTNGSGQGSWADLQLASAQTYRLAVRAVGPYLSLVLVDVICAEYSADQVAKRTGWSRDGIMVLLHVALQTLADHFRLPVQPDDAGRNRLDPSAALT